MDKAEKHSYREARKVSQNDGEMVQGVISNRYWDSKHSKKGSLEGSDGAGTDMQDGQRLCPLYTRGIIGHWHGRCSTAVSFST